MKQSVSSILDEDSGGGVLRELQKIDEKLDRLLDAADTDSDWEQVYTHVFKVVSRQVKPLLQQIGKRFPDYYDPDTTYEEDVRAWVEAFKKVYAEVK